jgi:ubiquinone/menaquinone biosynthesis C-methylase UbiE
VKLPFRLPPLDNEGPVPQWTGRGFVVDGKAVKVLRYGASTEGWSGDLTSFHETVSGDNHFIDKASRQLALEQLKKYPGDGLPVFLDVGCSSGAMLRSMKERFPEATVMGSDCIPEHLESLANELAGTPIFQFDVVQCPLPDASVDAVVMLNVLEHIENDAEAVRQVKRILKPGGILVLEVPAGPSLYDVYDRYLLHCRRYSLAGLRDLVDSAGFRIIRQSHLGCFLYPLFSLVKRRNQRYYKENSAQHKRIVQQEIQQTGDNLLLRFIMALELRMGRYASYPFGIRCLMTCFKP